MPINVFGSTSSSSSGNVNTSTFVQKPYLRSNYLESNMEEDIDMKNQFKIKNLPEPINLQDAATKNYVDTKNNSFVPIDEFDNDTIVRTNKNNNFNGNTIMELDSVYIRSDPEFPLQLIPKKYVDLSID